MQDWWSIVVFGAIIPVLMMGILVLREHLAGEPGTRGGRSQRTGSGSRIGPSRR